MTRDEKIAELKRLITIKEEAEAQIDILTAGGGPTNTDEPGKRKMGRPKGSKNNPDPVPVSIANGHDTPMATETATETAYPTTS